MVFLSFNLDNTVYAANRVNVYANGSGDSWMFAGAGSNKKLTVPSDCVPNSSATVTFVITAHPDSAYGTTYSGDLTATYQNFSHNHKSASGSSISMSGASPFVEQDGMAYDHVEYTATTTVNPGDYFTVGGKMLYNGEDKGTVYNIKLNYEKGYSHTLAYDANGGYPEPSSETVINAESTYSMTVSSTRPRRAGYIFDGWYYNGHTYWGGNSVSVGANETVTLVAQWEECEYDVRLYKNQPSDASSTVTKSSSDTDWTGHGTYYDKRFLYDLDTVPETTFYSLTGWHPDSVWYKTQGSGGSAYGSSVAGGSDNLTTTNNATISLYPNWIRNKYCIIYNGNNTTKNVYGDSCSSNYTGSTPDTNCEYDRDVTIASNGFKKTGYIFQHWNTKSDGTGTTYTEGQVIENANFTVQDGGTFTLYAIWEPITYTLQYNGNGNFNTAQGSYMHSGTIRYDQYITLEPNKFSRDVGQYPHSEDGNNLNTGYSFVGWGMSDDLKSPSKADGRECTNGATVRNLTTIDKSKVDLYALWKRDLHLRFDLNGGSFD